MLGNWFGKLVVTNLHRAILELRFWSLFQAAGAATAMVWSPSRWSAVQWCFGDPISSPRKSTSDPLQTENSGGGSVFTYVIWVGMTRVLKSLYTQRGTSWNARPRPALLGPPTPRGAWGIQWKRWKLLSDLKGIHENKVTTCVASWVYKLECLKTRSHVFKIGHGNRMQSNMDLGLAPHLS